MEKPFDEVEVVVALKLLNGDKALGPDGTSLAFFQHFWMYGEFERSLNTFFVALISKRGGAKESSYAELKEKWKQEQERKGVRMLMRLPCSISYDGRKKVGESGGVGVEGVNLLSFYEDQNS